MSRKLRRELQRLKNSGDTVLATELSSLLGDDDSGEMSEVSRRLLAQAAKEIQAGKVDKGHVALGAAIEAWRKEQDGEDLELPPEVTERLEAQTDLAPENAFDIPLPELTGDSPEFTQTAEGVISGFANLLISAGYLEEAKTYLSAYTKAGEARAMKKDVLTRMKAKYRRAGNHKMVASITRVLADGCEVPVDLGAESKASKMMQDAKGLDEGPKEQAMQAASMMKAAEDMMASPDGDVEEAMKMMHSAEEMYSQAAKACGTNGGKDQPMEKEVLEMEGPGAEELEAMQRAEAAVKQGNKVRAKKYLQKASKLERMRLVAALIKKGDMALAMEGLEEEEPGSEGQGGYAYEEGEGEEAPAPAPEPESEMPEDAQNEVKISDRLPPEEEGAHDDVSDQPEDEEAQELKEKVESAAKKKKMKLAAHSLSKLEKLEKEIRAGVKTAEEKIKDKALAKEGFEVWKKVQKIKLEAQLIMAEEMEDEDKLAEALEGMDKLDAEDAEGMEEVLDNGGEEAKGEELADSLDEPEGALPEGEPGMDDDGFSDEPMEMEELPEGDADELEEEMAEGMQYEVLQSVADLKKMKVSKEALAFTFWEDAKSEDPYWVIQAAGKPIAEVHLADQRDAEDIRAYFCDRVKWPTVIAQTAEKVGVYEMLTHINAKFYANAVSKSAFAKQAKKEALASVSGTRTAKLANLRQDFTEAFLVSADALNKGLASDAPNALKAAFAKKLSSLGFHNSGLLVEDVFAEASQDFVTQVVEGAVEYLEMPKAAFDATKKMVARASNIALSSAAQVHASNETLGQRLGRTSMPLGHVPDAEEAPALRRQIEASMQQGSERGRRDSMKGKLQLGRKF